MPVDPAPMTEPEKDLIHVTRAVAELRRGAPVLIKAGQTAQIVIAAEPASEARLAWLTALDPRPVTLVLPRIRAHALGFVNDPGRGFVATPIPGAMTVFMVQLLINPLQSSDSGELRFEAAGAVTLVQRQQRADRWDERPADLCPLAAAGIKLVKLARLLPALLTRSVSGAEADRLSAREVLSVSHTAIQGYEDASAATLQRVSEARMPLEEAEEARLIAYRSADGGAEHLAIVIGQPDLQSPVLTRLHSECFTGDLIGSLRCDCGPQLRGAIREIAAHPGGGIVLYLRQEGRGIGLVNKLRAYTLQDRGFDTLDANEQLGYDADERVYRPAAEMLRDLGIAKLRLLTNNPLKLIALGKWGIEVTERVAHRFPSNGHNEHYLATKTRRAGHLL